MTFERRNVGSSLCQPTLVDVDFVRGRGWVVTNPHVDAMGNDQDGDCGVIATAHNAGVRELTRRVIAAGKMTTTPKVIEHSRGFRLTFPG